MKKDDVYDGANLSESLESKSALGKKKLARKGYAYRKELAVKEQFVTNYENIQQQKQDLEEMDDEELLRAQAEKSQLKAMFREDDDGIKYYPVIIKAAQAGQMETLLTETAKIIGQ